MPGQQQDTDCQPDKTNGRSAVQALSKLKDQRLQRAGQRLQAAGKQGAHPHDASLPRQQQLNASSLPVASQPTCATGTPSCFGPHRPSCSQQHTGSNSHVVNRMVTTAVRGMQSTPPSRPGSVRASMEVTRGHSAVNGKAIPCHIVAAASIAGPEQHGPPAAAGQPAICATAKQLPAAAVTTQCPLAVQGISLSAQHTEVIAPAKARVGSAGRKYGIKRQSCPSVNGGIGSHEMGCGMAWPTFQRLAAAVRERALHLTKQQHEQQRLQLAQAVADQWLWLFHSRQQQRIADEHHRRQLTLAGWLGLQQEVSYQQLLQCQASLQASKQAFMQLSRCFLAWQQLMQQRQQMNVTVVAFQAQHHKQLLSAAVRDWHLQVDRLRGKRQLLLRGQAHWTFMSMLRCLHAWHSWVTDQHVKRLKHNRAMQHWRQAASRHVLVMWRERVAQAAYNWQQLARALCFHKHTLQRTAVRAWLLGGEQQQTRRTAVMERLVQLHQQQLLQLAQQLLRFWHYLAEQQRYLQQMEVELVNVLQQCGRQQVVWHWLRLVQYHKQLATAAAALSSVGGVWWGRHCLSRWQCVVEVMGGQRSAELGQLVQKRACIGTWLKYTEQRRLVAGKLSATKAALQHNKLTRILPAWQEAAAALHAKCQLQRLADEHFAAQQLSRLFLLWRHNAVASLEERQQSAAADELHKSVLLQRAWQAWHWYWWHSSMKRHVPELYINNLQQRAVAGWREVTAAKLDKELQWRQAVRHHYLHKLSKGLTGWQQAPIIAARKEQLLQSAEEQYCRHLQIRALKAWQGPFRQRHQHKRTQLAQAARHHQQHLKQQAVSNWKAAVAASKTEHAQQLQAEQQCYTRLLHKSLTAWRVVIQQEQAEQQQLAAAAEPAVQALQAMMQRRMLRAWRHVQAQQQRDRHQLLRAQHHHHHLLLLKSLTAWQQYSQHQQVKAAANLRATQYRSRAVAAGVLQQLRQHVTAAGVTRQRLFVAALHRRSWLEIRAWRAWRLTTAMSGMVRAVQQPQVHQRSARPHSTASSSMTPCHQQQLQPGLDAVAAAVVAASCSSMARWQQQWKQQWQLDISSRDQQQQQEQQQLAHHNSGQAAALSKVLAELQQNKTPTSSVPTAEQQQLVLAPPPAGVADVSRVTSRAAARRAPRLSAFLQDVQQQAGNTAASGPAGITGSLQSSSLQVQQQDQQHENCVLLPAAEGEGPGILNSCSPWRGSRPRMLLVQQQQQQPCPATCIRGAVAAVSAAPCAAAWYTPQVSKTKRPPPRQLRTAAGIVTLGRMQLPPDLQQQQQQRPPAAHQVLVGSDLQHQQPHQHQQPQDVEVEQYGSSSLQQEQHQQYHVQQQEQLWPRQQQYLPQQQCLEQQTVPQHLLRAMHVEQHHQQPLQQHQDMVQQQCWHGPHAAEEQHSGAYLAAQQSQQHNDNVQVLVVQHGQSQHTADLGLFQGLQPSSAQAFDRHLLQPSDDCAGTVPAGLLPHTPCALSSSSTSAVQQLTFLQYPLNNASNQALASTAAAAAQANAAGVMPQQQVPYTPMTRQVLQEEVSALERTLQHCKMLKAALHSRQQQATSLHQQVAVLTQRLQLPAQQLQGAATGLGTEADQQQPEEEVQHELIEAQRQLNYVESELSELQAEQARQQPRLAAIAERIQQLKTAASGRQPLQ